MWKNIRNYVNKSNLCKSIALKQYIFSSPNDY